LHFGQSKFPVGLSDTFCDITQETHFGFMQFIFPAFLFAAAAISIPILIHLFYFRRFKRLYFSHVRFLREVKEETDNRQKLRNLLVLLMRCLAILFLVLAFSQPFIPLSKNVKKGPKSVSVYLDNSFSMNALSKETSLLELAKKRARDIITAYAPGDRFQVLTNDFEGRDLRLIGQEEALARIDQVQVGPVSRSLSKVLIRQQQTLNTGTSDNRVSYLISDFQQTIADLSDFRDSTLAIFLVPMRAVQESNLSVDSCWFESPVQILNQPAALLVRLSNRGREVAQEVRLSLYHDGQRKPVGSLSLPAGESMTDTIRFNILHPGWHEAKVSITDYPVQFDDDYYFSFHVPERVRVLMINQGQENKYLQNAFRSLTYFQADNVAARALDYSKFSDYQLIVLNELADISSGLIEELRNYVKEGGNVLAFPGVSIQRSDYDHLLGAFEGGTLGNYEQEARSGSEINLEEFIFRDVYLNKSANLRLPSTKANYRLPINRGEPLLTYRDGSPMMVKHRLGGGGLYFFASPLQENVNNLMNSSEVFVPMLLRMALAGAKNSQLAYFIGKDALLESRHQASGTGELLYKLSKAPDENAGGQAETTAGGAVIPEQRILGSRVQISPGSSVHTSGWYRLTLNSASTLAVFAFNYDRKESALDYVDAEQLLEGLPDHFSVLQEAAEANFNRVVDEQNRGIVLWRWCLVFALLFLGLEVLLLRLWKS
jgi:hypothetical protein